MQAVVGLLVMLFEVSHGVETHCDGRQHGAQYYGALGGTVDIQLMNLTSAPAYQLLKNSIKILDSRNNTVNNTENKHLFILSNGILRINNLSCNDSGNYTLQTFDSNGTASAEQTLQLFIQAPVSSVLLVSKCLSQGEMRVSCSSEGGDSPQYSWTLDRRTLTDAELLSRNNESNIITLKQNVSGHLICSVSNNVSNVSKGQNISTCGFIFINCTLMNGTQISRWVYEANNTLCIEPTTRKPTADPTTVTKTAASTANSTSITPTQTVSSDGPWYIIYNNLPLIAGVLSALIIFLVVGIAVICAHRKKQNSKPTKQKEEEDDKEVTYADIRVIKREGKHVEQRVEVEVEYGQVKFSKQPEHSEPTGDDCMQANADEVK